MIRLFKEYKMERLEYIVNDYIDTCGSKIESIQYQTTIDADGDIVYSVCIVHDLSFVNSYK